MSHERRTSDARPGRGAVFAPRQARLIFREMTRAEIQGGVLRGSKRRQLLRFARNLGIPRQEAALIMADVQHGRQGLEAAGCSPAQLQARLRAVRARHAVVVRLMMASGLALIVDALLIGWLF